MVRPQRNVSVRQKTLNKQGFEAILRSLKSLEPAMILLRFAEFSSGCLRLLTESTWRSSFYEVMLQTLGPSSQLRGILDRTLMHPLSGAASTCAFQTARELRTSASRCSRRRACELLFFGYFFLFFSSFVACVSFV